MVAQKKDLGNKRMLKPQKRNYLSVSIYGYTDPPSIDLNDFKPLPNESNESRPNGQSNNDGKQTGKKKR